MQREAMLSQLRNGSFDIVVIGGGATGLGITLDATTRGYRTALLERFDFGSGTSSRSTKLVHGGVRYLRQGNIGLVRDALRERRRLLRNAPHCVHRLPFVIPTFSFFETAYYRTGLAAYDLLAGRDDFPNAGTLGRFAVRDAIPGINKDRLRGGVRYFDGQFDDARLCVDLARTAAEHGATLLNYAEVVGVERGAVTVRVDGETLGLSAKVVINAAGPFTDSVRRLADADAAPMVAASRGSHIVLPLRFLGGETALMVPKTPDGRVLFAIPWHGVAVVGTTDIPMDAPVADPTATDAEIDYILETLNPYLAHPATRGDILSTFAGIRPLVSNPNASNTAALSRDHTIVVDGTLLTITGGKWTTYRKMAEDAVDRAATIADLPAQPCKTADLPIIPPTDVDGERLHPDLPITGGHVRRAVDDEMAVTADDVLSRRTRCALLNAAATDAIRPTVEAMMRA
ncbi:MAG: glycerol-3-phosphate dehydrogenase/oxidase [Planctomycetota bacterium]